MLRLTLALAVVNLFACGSPWDGRYSGELTQTVDFSDGGRSETRHVVEWTVQDTGSDLIIQDPSYACAYYRAVSSGGTYEAPMRQGECNGISVVGGTVWLRKGGLEVLILKSADDRSSATTGWVSRQQ